MKKFVLITALALAPALASAENSTLAKAVVISFIGSDSLDRPPC